MQINLVVNLKYLKLFEYSMLDGENTFRFFPTVEDFAMHTLEELGEDTIL
jgi:hypothetical protein